MATATFLDILTRKPRNIAVLTNPDHELYLQQSDRPTPGPGQCLVHGTWWYEEKTGLVMKAQA
ncbi:hypothetical protein F5Y08DRAFT_341534 [Xylaria arbuscula]|nr:hypothetical protein F5Y08DRAFT_341534 [Xylaria arbuscula]